ncbi:MAG: hypothetical protein HC904_04810 [Blastochloris sp.]|nr:hypothetical protein [Blastochloris sp.]
MLIRRWALFLTFPCLLTASDEEFFTKFTEAELAAIAPISHLSIHALQGKTLHLISEIPVKSGNKFIQPEMRLQEIWRSSGYYIQADGTEIVLHEEPKVDGAIKEGSLYLVKSVTTTETILSNREKRVFSRLDLIQVDKMGNVIGDGGPIKRIYLRADLEARVFEFLVFFNYIFRPVSHMNYAP